MQTSQSFGKLPNIYPNYWIDGSNIDSKWSKIVIELGDNQSPALQKGDVVLSKKTRKVRNGFYGVLTKDGHFTFGRVRKTKDRIKLYPSSESQVHIEVSPESIQCTWRCFSLIRRKLS